MGRVLTFFLLACPLIIPALLAGHSSALGAAVLDKETAGCVECHRTSIMTGSRGSVVCHKDGCGHPIAMDYIKAVSGNKGLKSPEKLHPSVKLIDGKIGCTTCHAPYNEYDHIVLYEKRKEASMPDPMLVMDNSFSGLCLACHDK